MFGHKKEKEQENLSAGAKNNIAKDSYEPKKAIDVKDFPVHSMKDDLKKTSVIKTPTILKRKVENYENPSGKIEIKKTSSGWGKPLAYIITLLIIVIAGAGGYYFWMTRIKNSPSTPSSAINQSGITQNNTPKKTQPDFSITQANYLQLDISNLSKDSFQKTISDTADKLHETSDPVEFILTDNSNNPISFSDFSQKVGLELPQTVLSQLNDNFSIYIYLENNEAKLGVSVSARNSANLKTAMSNEENLLVKDLEPLFMGNPYAPQSTYTFKSSSYNGNSIRYTNIVSPTELSVDYTVSPKQLIIGTTKKALRSILDHISSLSTPANPTAQNM